MAFIRLALHLFFCGLICYICADSPRWDLMRQNDYTVDCHHIDVVWYNKSYGKIKQLEMIKYNRSFQRVLNFSGDLYKEIGSDVKVKVQLYKLHGTQYKYFPVTATLKICPEYLRNSFGVQELVSKFSNAKPCPLKPGHIYVKHLHVDDSKLPQLMPSGSYKGRPRSMLGKTS